MLCRCVSCGCFSCCAGGYYRFIIVESVAVCFNLFWALVAHHVTWIHCCDILLCFLVFLEVR